MLPVVTTAVEFLRAILPPEGCYIAVILKDKNHVQIVCPTIEKLAQVIIKNDEAGRTVYHACASFKDPKGVWNERTKKFEKRSHANVLAVSCLWSDLDCGDGKPYQNAAEAYQATITFCQQQLCPYPIIVASGSGIHLYWLLDKAYAFEPWTQIATAWKRFLIDGGLRIDPVRTADASSILRTPGTHNRKRGDDVLVTWSGLDNVRALSPNDLERLRAFAPTAAAPAGQRGSSELHRNIIGAPDFPPADFKRIATECGQIACFRQSGNLSEPRWFASVGVTAYCTNGREITHALSKNDFPDYSYEETDTKIDRVLGLSGATTCKRFEFLNPDVCRRCPHYGKINSPIVLGYGARATEGSGYVLPKIEGIPEINIDGFDLHSGKLLFRT